MFVIEEKHRNERGVYYIYNYKITMEELDELIIETVINNKNLNYIFTLKKSDAEKKERLLQLRRFIPIEFKKREKFFLEDWDKGKEIIENGITDNVGYYSFFAEALMATLNIKYINSNLNIAVLGTNETLVDQRTGADVCMHDENCFILGEAKFYKSFTSGSKEIIDNFQNSSSFINKLSSLYNSIPSNKKIVVVQNLEYDYEELTFDEFKKSNLILSGFVLHNRSERYNYCSIDEINLDGLLLKYQIVFYHLPIQSKEELILKTIKRCLEEIVHETN